MYRVEAAGVDGLLQFVIRRARRKLTAGNPPLAAALAAWYATPPFEAAVLNYAVHPREEAWVVSVWDACFML